MDSFNFSFNRRCIAVDLGQSRVKAILAERKGRKVEVLHAFTLDLQEEGLLTQEETNRHIGRILNEMGDYPISLVIPQHIAVSHLVSLPSQGNRGWVRMIEAETQKLTGLSESAIVYDYFRLKPFPGTANPVWVTVSREKELEAQIKRLQGSGLTAGEVTNASNALASAFLATQAPEKRAVLVDLGASTTTVVILENSQPVYATAFPFAGELFTEAVALARGTGFDEAETIKKTRFLYQEKEEEFREFRDAVDRWHDELRKVIAEGLKDEIDSVEDPVKVFFSGGPSLQPGFLDYLREGTTLNYHFWRDGGCGVDLQTHALTYGGALAGLKIAPVSSSLLPSTLRQDQAKARQTTKLNMLTAVMLAVLFVLLIADTSVRRQALAERESKIADLEEAYAKTRMVDDLLVERSRQYDNIVPLVQQQKQTRDLLKTIGLMQEIAGESDLWFVSLADGQSYLDQSTLPRNSPGPSGGRDFRSRGAFSQESPAAVEGPSPHAPWEGFVAEVSVPGTGWEIHESLRTIVNTFGGRGIFRNVDTLAGPERKQVVNSEVTLPDQTFSISLELNPSQFSLISTAPDGGPDRP